MTNNKNKRNYNFEKNQDFYTYSNFRIKNGNQQRTYRYKNGRLVNVFDQPIEYNSYSPTFNPNVIYTYPKNKKRSQIHFYRETAQGELKSTKNNFDNVFSESQLLTYNLKNYNEYISYYKSYLKQKKNLKNYLINKRRNQKKNFDERDYLNALKELEDMWDKWSGVI